MSLSALLGLPHEVVQTFAETGFKLLALLGVVSILSMLYWTSEMWFAGTHGTPQKGFLRSIAHQIVVGFVTIASLGYGFLFTTWFYSDVSQITIQAMVAEGFPAILARLATGGVFLLIIGVAARMVFLLHTGTTYHLIWVNSLGYVGDGMSREEVVEAIRTGHMSSLTFGEVLTRVRNRTGAFGLMIGAIGTTLGAIYVLLGIPSGVAIVSGMVYITALLLTTATIAAAGKGIIAKTTQFTQQS
jgi:hypothetical protein